MIEPLMSLPREVLAELREMTIRGPRAKVAIATALAVGAAIVAALVLQPSVGAGCPSGCVHDTSVHVPA